MIYYYNISKMDLYLLISEQMNECMYDTLSYAIHHEYEKILVFAFGTAHISNTPIINIYNKMKKIYNNKQIIIYCFDPEFNNEKIMKNTDSDLRNVNFLNMKKNIYEKYDSNNIFTIILSSMKMPMNARLPLIIQYLNTCIKQNKLSEYYNYMLNHDEHYNFHFQLFFSEIVDQINPLDIIFMNDIFFNSWCYYYNDDNNNIMYKSDIPIKMYNDKDKNLAKKLNLVLPEENDICYRGCYDTNVLFNEMIWVLKLIDDLSKKHTVYIIEYYIHINLYTSDNNIFMFQYINDYSKHICLE